MYSQSEYLYGWLIYLIAAGVLIGCFWWLTTAIRNKEIKYLLRIIVGVVLLVPWYSSPELSYLAPAWLIAAFEGVFDGGEAFWRAGAPLLIVLSVAVVISIVIQLVLRFRSSPPPSNP